MDTLSSCYFCSTALDEPLSEYPLVPDRGDDATTVVLCPGCHRKLEPIVEAVRNAVATHATGVEAVDHGDFSREDDSRDVGATAAESGGADAGGSDRPATAADGEDAETAPGESGLDNPSEPVDPGDAGDGSGKETDEGTSGIDRQSTGDADEEKTGDAVSTPGTEAGGADTDDGGSTRRTSLSTKEYNKVIRLLQNREFPVDRDEFETVAANAYSLGRRDVAEVIDLAVDRGVLTEESGQLTRAE